MPELAGGHDDLAAVMAFMRNEVGEKVTHVELKITPAVRLRIRNAAIPLAAKPQQPGDGGAAALQRRDQLPGLDLVAIDTCRRQDPMLPAERLDPHASGVVEVAGEHADGTPRSSRNRRRPKFAGQILDEKDRDSVVGFPGVNDHV